MPKNLEPGECPLIDWLMAGFTSVLLECKPACCLFAMQAICSRYGGFVEVVNPLELALEPVVCCRLPFSVSACCFLPGGHNLACGGSGGELLLLDHARGIQLHRVHVHRSCITACRFSEQAQLLAVGDERGVISVWDLAGDSFKMVQLCR